MRWTPISAMDEDKLKSFWRKIKHGASFWGKLEGKSFAAFKKVLGESAMLFELPYGYIRVEYTREIDKTWIHGAFWSKDVFKHIQDLRGLGQDIAETVGTKELCLMIPTLGRGLHHLVEEVGFKWVGTVRDYYKLGDGCSDAFLYAMIME